MSWPHPSSDGKYRSLPPEATLICDRLSAAPRLVAHLVLVHDTACSLIERIEAAFPSAQFDVESICFGAATHDIGKTAHPQELTKSGEKHERAGVEILEALGVPKERARFAYTHANWNGPEQIKMEDLLVALADKCWKGKRDDELEGLMVDVLSAASGTPKWDCYAKLDEILQSIALDADARLAWQQRFGV